MFNFNNKFFILIIFLFSFKISTSQISFNVYQKYSTGSWPEVVKINDINNDGKNDVVVGTGTYFDQVNDYKLFAFIQNALGEFYPANKYSYNPIRWDEVINSIEISDLNDDLLNDVIIGYGDSIGVFYQNANGTLNPIFNIWTGVNSDTVDSKSINIAVGDINADNKKDIVIYQGGQTRLIVLKQLVNGGFSKIYLQSPNYRLSQIEIKDINNDKLNDILFLGDNGGLFVYYQKTDNNFAFTEFANSKDKKYICTTYGDLNNDGFSDLIIANSTANTSDNLEIYLYNRNTRLLDYYKTLSTPKGIRSVSIDDLDCDGNCEIITLHSNSSKVCVYQQNSAFQYSTYQTFSIPNSLFYRIKALSIGDVNSDGLKDIAVADYQKGLIILINKSKNMGKCCKMPIKPYLPDGNEIICSDNSIEIYNSIVEENAKWYISPSEAGLFVNSSNDSCIVAWNNEWRGTADLFVKSENSCGFRISDTLKVTSARLPNLFIGKDTILCPNSVIRLKANDGFDYYKWHDNNQNYIYNVMQPGLYSLVAGNICGQRKDTIKIIKGSNPIINLPNDTLFCKGNSLLLDITMKGKYKYLWSNGSTNSKLNIYTNDILKATLIDSNSCFSNKTIVVNEVLPPDVYLPIDTFVCPNQFLHFNVTLPFTKYNWSNGINSGSINISQSGLYSLKMTNICAEKNYSVNVEKNDCIAYIDVPTAFSPNNDGNNDVLYVVGENIKTFRLEMFDRFGNKVFETDNMKNGWDGTKNGELLEPSVFFYQLFYNSFYNKSYILKGNVTLFR